MRDPLVCPMTAAEYRAGADRTVWAARTLAARTLAALLEREALLMERARDSERLVSLGRELESVRRWNDSTEAVLREVRQILEVPEAHEITRHALRVMARASREASACAECLGPIAP